MTIRGHLAPTRCARASACRTRPTRSSARTTIERGGSRRRQAVPALVRQPGERRHARSLRLLYANSTDGLHGRSRIWASSIFQGWRPSWEARHRQQCSSKATVSAFTTTSTTPTRRAATRRSATRWLSPTLAFNADMSGCENLYVPAPGANAPRTKRFHGVIASSADGLVFHRDHVVNVSWPPPQKWDTHNNVFFDETSQSYVVTTRNIPVESTGVERDEPARSAPRFEDFDFSQAPPVIMRGNISHQTYAQVTFPWLDVYLGLVMVFDSDTGDQVHCRLTFAPAPEGPWRGGRRHHRRARLLAARWARSTRTSSSPAPRPSATTRAQSGCTTWAEMGRTTARATRRLRWRDGYASVRGAGVFRTPSLVGHERDDHRDRRLRRRGRCDRRAPRRAGRRRSPSTSTTRCRSRRTPPTRRCSALKYRGEEWCASPATRCCGRLRAAGGGGDVRRDV